jgi:hypothetical protein
VDVKMNHGEQFREVQAKCPDPFVDKRCRKLAYEVGVITLLFGNLEAILSFYIGFLISDPTGVMFKYAEKLQFTDRVGLFCDLVAGRCPEYKDIVDQLKRDLRRISEKRNIIVHNGIKDQGDKLLLSTIDGKPIDAFDLQEIINKLLALNDRVATVWMTLHHYTYDIASIRSGMRDDCDL